MKVNFRLSSCNVATKLQSASRGKKCPITSCIYVDGDGDLRFVRGASGSRSSVLRPSLGGSAEGPEVYGVVGRQLPFPKR